MELFFLSHPLGGSEMLQAIEWFKSPPARSAAENVPTRPHRTPTAPLARLAPHNESELIDLGQRRTQEFVR